MDFKSYDPVVGAYIGWYFGQHRDRGRGPGVVCFWDFKGWDPADHRKLAWRRIQHNLVPLVGLNQVLSVYFKAVAASATQYIGLIAGASAPTFVTGDTMASHPGWTEIASGHITQTVRQTWTPGTVSAGSVDNSAAPVGYTANASDTLQGGFMVDNNTLGGTAGVLFSEAAFTAGAQAIVTSQPITVVVTITAVSA